MSEKEKTLLPVDQASEEKMLKDSPKGQSQWKQGNVKRKGDDLPKRKARKANA